MLQLINTQIKTEEASGLDEIPDDEENEETVKGLKRGKAPGLDGVTADCILSCWEFVRDDCCSMVRAFWTSKSMLERDVRGCIKLLPKTEVRQNLKNWRPVTLMSCTYKIISKLIATRIKKLLPGLVAAEQTGFVPGRRIEDNVLTLRMAEEWSKQSGENNLFVKLDFSKAFDRVSFKFLWGVLRGMGFSEATRQRISALMVGGSSTIHVNQDFSETVKIRRGEVPDWVRTIGCEIADQRKRFKFLGVWSGRSITDKEVSDEVLRSIQKKIQMWGNRYLSWKSRLVLIKHICFAIPQHHLMSIGLDQKGLQRINNLLNHFLWGWTETGAPKTVLISWDKLHIPKNQGGLEWIPLEVKMQSFMVMKVIRVLKQSSEGWLRLMEAMLKKHTEGSMEFRGWTVQELLLLGKKFRIRGAITLTRILSSWFNFRKHVRWRGAEIRVPSDLTLSKLEAFLEITGEGQIRLLRAARKWFRKLKWKKVEDFLRIGDVVENTEQELWKEGLFLEEQDRITLREVVLLLGGVKLMDGSIEQATGWNWANLPMLETGWAIQRRQVQQLMLSEWQTRPKIQSAINGCAHIDQQQWKDLWECTATSKTKLEIWKWKDCIAIAIRNARTDIAGIELIAAWCQETWSERNKFVFENKTRETPLRVILNRAHLLTSSRTIKASEEREAIRQSSLRTLELWKDRLIRRPRIIQERDSNGSSERESAATGRTKQPAEEVQTVSVVHGSRENRWLANGMICVQEIGQYLGRSPDRY
ncbi:hypothetical protein R1sor_009416 [Riccia sorocarpa]|uniref:Reverse transcriptase domain-containing protein n=1 Tax=Riccia sorocarpa TaxID=122646 RepID=A0ABD3HV08_9MARC